MTSELENMKVRALFNVKCPNLPMFSKNFSQILPMFYDYSNSFLPMFRINLENLQSMTDMSLLEEIKSISLPPK